MELELRLTFAIWKLGNYDPVVCQCQCQLGLFLFRSKAQMRLQIFDANIQVLPSAPAAATRTKTDRRHLKVRKLWPPWPVRVSVNLGCFCSALKL